MKSVERNEWTAQRTVGVPKKILEKRSNETGDK